MSNEMQELLPGGSVRWVLSKEERQSIAESLDIEEHTFSKLKGNIMTRTREACQECGKLSGLDDFIQNAMEMGVHSRDFIIDVLHHGPQAASPAHGLQCSKCGEHFEGVWAWETEDWAQ
ncbi:hypothetical protein TWF281_011104 [Arthrobotrys megalospora]